MWHYHLNCTNIAGGGETLEEDLRKRNHHSSKEDLVTLEQCLAGRCSYNTGIVRLL
jgi:hypothetical protein